MHDSLVSEAESEHNTPEYFTTQLLSIITKIAAIEQEITKVQSPLATIIKIDGDIGAKALQQQDAKLALDRLNEQQEKAENEIEALTTKIKELIRIKPRIMLEEKLASLTTLLAHVDDAD